MNDSQVLITHPYALLAIIMLIPVALINLANWTRWKLFDYLPPIIWIFVLPIFLSNLKIIPTESSTYDAFKAFAVPMFIILMLLDVDIRATMKVAMRSLGVMIAGAFGVVVGGIFAFFLLKGALGPEDWRSFGALTGSWIGGTGNLAAVAEMVDTPPAMMGVVIIADTFIFILYFPLLFACKRWAAWYNRFTGAKEEETRDIEAAARRMQRKPKEMQYLDALTLFGVGFFLIWLVGHVSELLPAKEGVFTAKTWSYLILTTAALFLSVTRLRNVPGTSAMSMALVYSYLSMIGAQADIRQAAGAPYFLLAGIICIVVHLVFCVLAARLLHVDVRMTAIASVASIGGAASAPVVAVHHGKELVPVAILLALVGYALGNYLGVLAAHGCRWVM